ncbi:MAG: nitrogen fixation protein NifD [Acidobacteria bacterium RIFCSPLOWO2_12_FULL_60_22]|nr:MAG: nitrogen fixation protein NifD [Acidobacteria bacterium RIFCSPLOWO2_12_FULL_60_22]
MKMIWATLRPEKINDAISNLEKAGFYAFTRLDVMGRGRQKGIMVGSSRYEEVAKTTLLVVVEDQEADRAVETLKIAARTGNPGDGKIFVSPLGAVYSIRTKSRDR